MPLFTLGRTATDFGMVRREVVDLVKLMVPTLQQKLYSELNRKLIEVSEVGLPSHPACIDSLLLLLGM